MPLSMSAFDPVQSFDRRGLVVLVFGEAQSIRHAGIGSWIAAP
jgi:hypothetical protein